MTIIYKYELMPGLITEVYLPVGATPLSVAFQDDNLQMWVEQRKDGKYSPRRFQAFATGEALPMGHDSKSFFFVGSAHSIDGPVYHVYELIGIVSSGYPFRVDQCTSRATSTPKDRRITPVTRKMGKVCIIKDLREIRDNNVF